MFTTALLLPASVIFSGLSVESGKTVVYFSSSLSISEPVCELGVLTALHVGFRRVGVATLTRRAGICGVRVLYAENIATGESTVLEHTRSSIRSRTLLRTRAGLLPGCYRRAVSRP